MREISFEWKGQTVRLTPSMLLLSRMANDIRKATDGAETTVSLAYKCINGGAEPVFMVVAMRGFLQEAMGSAAPSDEEIWDHLSTNPKETVSFRMAYAEAVLPHISLGKERAALLTAPKAARQKTSSRRKSTSKAST